MASSFIHLGTHGFWANDGFVEAMQLCLLQAIEQGPQDTEVWLIPYKEALAFQAMVRPMGTMSLALDEFLTDPPRRDCLRGLLDTLIERIESDPAYLSGPNLHAGWQRALEIGVESQQLCFASAAEFGAQVQESGWQDYRFQGLTARYLRAFQLLRKLVAGELTTTAASPIDYWNY